MDASELWRIVLQPLSSIWQLSRNRHPDRRNEDRHRHNSDQLHAEYSAYRRDLHIRNSSFGGWSGGAALGYLSIRRYRSDSPRVAQRDIPALEESRRKRTLHNFEIGKGLGKK